MKGIKRFTFKMVASWIIGTFSGYILTSVVAGYDIEAWDRGDNGLFCLVALLMILFVHVIFKLIGER